MHRFACSVIGAAALLLGVGTNSATAQNPALPPPVSPYLNLLRAGSSPAVNFYGLVRPQIETRNSLRRLQQEVSANQQQMPIPQEDDAGLPATGHAAQFGTERLFFMTRGAQSAGGAPSRSTFFSPGMTGRGLPGMAGRRNLQ
jgi:hypothetical protein